jgi:general secretion pathway protein G
MLITNHRRLARRGREAFTLLEVLVVVAIIVILAGVATVSLFRYLEDARDQTAQAQMSTLEEGCKAYMIKNEGNPPQSLMELVQPTDGSKPLVEGGPNMLKSPHGIMYQYDPSHMDPYNSPDPMVSLPLPSGKILYSPKRQKANQ